MGKTEKIKKSTLGTKFYFHRCKFIMNLSQIIDTRSWLIIFPMEMNHFGGKKFFLVEKYKFQWKMLFFGLFLVYSSISPQWEANEVSQCIPNEPMSMSERVFNKKTFLDQPSIICIAPRSIFHNSKGWNYGTYLWNLCKIQ